MSSERRGWHTHSQFLTLGADTAHYVSTRDEGRPVLLLHGLLVSSWSWRHNLEPLSQHLRPIALCLKGFGWSTKQRERHNVAALTEFVLRFMDEMGLDQVDLVGNSLGGAVSLRLALDHPDRVRKLVLVAPAAVPLGRITPFLTIQGPLLTQLYRRVGQVRSNLFYRTILERLVYHQLPVDSSYMQRFMEPLQCGGAVYAAASATHHLARDVRSTFERLDDLEAPALLAWGAHDGLLPLRAGHILSRVLPGARLEVFPDAGHCPQEEAPERFNRLLLDFLKPEK